MTRRSSCAAEAGGAREVMEQAAAQDRLINQCDSPRRMRGRSRSSAALGGEPAEPRRPAGGLQLLRERVALAACAALGAPRRRDAVGAGARGPAPRAARDVVLALPAQDVDPALVVDRVQDVVLARPLRRRGRAAEREEVALLGSCRRARSAGSARRPRTRRSPPGRRRGTSGAPGTSARSSPARPRPACRRRRRRCPPAGPGPPGPRTAWTGRPAPTRRCRPRTRCCCARSAR